MTETDIANNDNPSHQHHRRRRKKRPGSTGFFDQRKWTRLFRDKRSRGYRILRWSALVIILLTCFTFGYFYLGPNISAVE